MNDAEKRASDYWTSLDSAEEANDFEREIQQLVTVLKEIANEDYRGNRSSGSVKAYQVLKKLGYME